MLATLNFTNPFVVEYDASVFGISVVLMQDDHMISFDSRKLNKREILKYTYDKEMISIIHVLSKWQQYLLGNKLLICIDHNNC